MKTRVKEVGIGKTEGTAGMVKIHGGASEDPVPLVRKADAFSSGSLEIIVSLCIRFRQEASGRYEAGDSGWSRMDPGGASREPPRRFASKKDVTTMKKLMTVLALLALCAMPVMAEVDTVDVTLDIEQYMSITADDETIQINVPVASFEDDGIGEGTENAGFSWITNVDADITAALSVSGCDGADADAVDDVVYTLVPGNPVVDNTPPGTGTGSVTINVTVEADFGTGDCNTTLTLTISAA